MKQSSNLKPNIQFNKKYNFIKTKKVNETVRYD